jgi:hypothetical protein
MSLLMTYFTLFLIAPCIIMQTTIPSHSVIQILMHLHLHCTLETDSNQLIEWFRINQMQANPDKFQFLAVGRKTYDKYPSIYIQNFELTCESTVKNYCLNLLVVLIVS